jgi:NADPH-dependent F420 reductase
MSRRIAVIGGTGHLGAALAGRWARAGLSVTIGSRDAARAAAAAAAIGHGARDATYREAAETAEVIVLAVPFAAQEATIAEILPVAAGRIVVDTTVPMVPPKVMRVQLPAEGCAALRTQALFGDGVTLVSAFHNVAAHKLAEGAPVDCDVLVFGDDKAARSVVVELARQAGLRGLHGGALANSAAAEALTSILIFLNKTYGIDGAGIRITGTMSAPAA